MSNFCGSILPAIYIGVDWLHQWSITLKSGDEYDLAGTIWLRLVSGSTTLAESQAVTAEGKIQVGFTAAQTAAIPLPTPSPELLMIHQRADGQTYVLFSRRIDIRSAGA